MVYTIRNHCEEDPTISYDDGARKIFLYTRGTEGTPSQELKDILKYIEKSTNDNVTNQSIASIQELVNKVKRRTDIGVNYMKSWEIEEILRRDSYKEGFNNGFSDGFSDGSTKGQQEMQEKINQLNLLLSEAGRTNDILKAAQDKDYQEGLFKEFNL